jgi:predicted TIM-barrel fold metal-dependent hydrolase
VIVDFHTHVFPPEVADKRDSYLATEATFRELYRDARARLAATDDLLRSMDAAAVDVSVALGFAWHDAGLTRRHNDYLVESAMASDGRVVPFCTLPLGAGIVAVEQEMLRCIEHGVRGFGELRPDNLGFDLAGDEGKRLGEIASASGVILLFHASEPVGHRYAGKKGLSLAKLYEFIVDHPQARIVAAHWGGGLPFYALMPEVKLALANVAFDTAGTSLLYNPEIYARVGSLLGAGSILFGSDFPLLGQKRSRERIELSGMDLLDVEAVLGGNAAKMLGLSPPE